MKKNDIVKFAGFVDGNEARERFLLIEDPDGNQVQVKVICNLPTKPIRALKVSDLEIDKRKMAFREARLRACNVACDECGKVKNYPEGLGLYEELFCGSKWLCENCFPEVYEENED